MNLIEKIISKIIDEAFRNELSVDELLFRIKNALKKHSIKNSILQEVLLDAEKQYAFVQKRTIKKEDSVRVAEILGEVGKPLGRLERKYSKEIAESITEAFRQQKNAKDIELILRRKFGAIEYRARTVSNTAMGMFGRSDNIERALKVGVKKFKLVGAPPKRKWCKLHYKKIYTIDEIREMDNGQGLSVLHSCGGYNCNHEWSPVIE